MTTLMTVSDVLMYDTFTQFLLHGQSVYSTKYQFVALMRLKHFQSEYEEARRKDAQFLESKIALYASHNKEVLRELKIQQRAMTDALVAMQRVSLLILVQW